MNALSTTLLQVLACRDPGQGVGPIEQELNAYDLVFPVIAFILVILLPMATGVWVLVRTLKDQQKEPDET